MSNPSPDKMLPRIKVSATCLRTLFNNDRYYEKASLGKLSIEIGDCRHLESPQKIGEPYCTHFQYIVYLDDDKKAIAGVAQYVRPDGSLGASGKPDPKWIERDSVILTVHETK